MTNTLDANISHAFYISNVSFGSARNFYVEAGSAFKNAVEYSLSGNTSHPYIKEMQTAERFLHGGGQTYSVSRMFLDGLSPDLAAVGISDWCTILSYFPEVDILAVSFHYSLKNKTSDDIIALRQSGENRKYPFPDGDMSCIQLAENITKSLNIDFKISERSFLCEITKFGEYEDLNELEEKELCTLYGIITGDEGYMFVPKELAAQRLSCSWGSRDFIRIYAFGRAFLFLNLIGSPSHTEYLQRQTSFGTSVYGGCDDYFFMRSCPLTVNHGIFFSVEFTMMLKTLIGNVMAYQSEYDRQKGSFYHKIKATRDFRRKIIMVLERVEHTEISEIGELSTILLDSQHIEPIVDRVKYLLELLESDLDLMYSERNNTLVTILTILGLLLALAQIVLPMLPL